MLSYSTHPQKNLRTYQTSAKSGNAVKRPQSTRKPPGAANVVWEIKTGRVDENLAGLTNGKTNRTFSTILTKVSISDCNTALMFRQSILISFLALTLCNAAYSRDECCVGDPDEAYILYQVSAFTGQTYPMAIFVAGSAQWNKPACEFMRDRMMEDGPHLNWHCKPAQE